MRRLAGRGGAASNLAAPLPDGQAGGWLIELPDRAAPLGAWLEEALGENVTPAIQPPALGFLSDATFVSHACPAPLCARAHSSTPPLQGDTSQPPLAQTPAPLSVVWRLFVLSLPISGGAEGWAGLTCAYASRPLRGRTLHPCRGGPLRRSLRVSRFECARLSALTVAARGMCARQHTCRGPATPCLSQSGTIRPPPPPHPPISFSAHHLLPLGRGPQRQQLNRPS